MGICELIGEYDMCGCCCLKRGAGAGVGNDGSGSIGTRPDISVLNLLRRM